MAAVPAADRERLGVAARRLGMQHPVVEPLAGGSRNRCYRLSGGGRTAVLRIAGEHDERYAVLRPAELLAQRLAAEHGLAPAVLFEDAVGGITAMALAPGSVWSRETASSPEAATRLGRWLRRLHAIALPASLPAVSYAANLRRYCGRLGPSEPAMRLCAAAGTVAARLRPAAALALCHHDLHHRNLIESAQGLLAIDWEYAGAGDPLFDLAGFIAYHDLGRAARDSLLKGYGHGEIDAGRLADARWLFEAVWWAWLELRRRDAPDDREARAASQRLEVRLGIHGG